MTTSHAPASQDQRFSAMVRSATLSDHQRAAMSGFMTALFDRSLPRSGYTEMVAQHYFAYASLEAAGDALADHRVAGQFVDESLRRVPALRRDMATLAGPDWESRYTPSAATRAYCERMDQVCVASPERFVAHHYTRYLGDLSGGQMIGRLAKEVYGLDDGAGAAFYEFDLIDDPAAFKDQYRLRLDDAAWTTQQREDLLDEVRVAYRCNTEVFDELDRALSSGSFS